MTKEKEYENFIRKAFSHFQGNEIRRYEDPAKLADAGKFRGNKIAKVKVSLGYAMHIFISEIIETIPDDIKEQQRLNNFITRVVKANDLSEISSLITKFKTTVVDKYYTESNGHLSII